MRRTNASTRSILAVLLLAVVASGCGMSRGGDGADAPERVLTTVSVQNNNWLDMVIYAVRSGSRVRLGMVNSMNTEQFRLPILMTGGASDIRLEAHPIGQRQPFRAPPIYVSAGQTIELTLQNHLAISTISVW